MITIRPEQIQDIAAIREVNDLAFKGENESKLVEAIRQSEFFVPELSLVALHDNQVIGHILFSIISIETEAGPVPTLALAPMSVRPQYQNQGIGSSLVKEGLQKCRQLGYKHTAVLGHPEFYSKFGFTPSVTKGIAAPFPVPDEVFMVIELQENSLDSIKGKVKYPSAFGAVS
ncbi:GNAT family N-acetyltransferase [Fictibacillus aquaticus]|uniref:GNAT family N-acetyltransferase n=1 Tax=Fictibacillus aquaticus TaxID=2021314 RepID=A0A235F9A3_9BACL|nr:N-acetyltransferase [Fictibacillus aquaticus]OYD57285.1 GNAT family N-acetyltransferase [Fictibacillus aquaticus]